MAREKRFGAASAIVTVVMIFAFVASVEGEEKFPAWAERVFGSKHPDLVCLKLERWMKQPESKPDSEEWKGYRAQGIEAARALLALYGLPWSVRNDARPCLEDGSRPIYTYLSSRIMEAVVETLIKVRAVPTDINQSEDSLRRMLAADLKLDIAEIRRLMKSGETATAKGMDLLADRARVGIDKWGFTAADLGLTDDEMKLLKEYKARAE